MNYTPAEMDFLKRSGFILSSVDDADAWFDVSGDERRRLRSDVSETLEGVLSSFRSRDAQGRLVHGTEGLARLDSGYVTLDGIEYRRENFGPDHFMANPNYAAILEQLKPEFRGHYDERYGFLQSRAVADELGAAWLAAGGNKRDIVTRWIENKGPLKLVAGFFGAAIFSDVFAALTTQAAAPVTDISGMYSGATEIETAASGFSGGAAGASIGANVVVTPYVDVGAVTGIPLAPWVAGTPAWPSWEQLTGTPWEAGNVAAPSFPAPAVNNAAPPWQPPAAPIEDPFVDIGPPTGPAIPPAPTPAASVAAKAITKGIESTVKNGIDSIAKAIGALGTVAAGIATVSKLGGDDDKPLLGGYSPGTLGVPGMGGAGDTSTTTGAGAATSSSSSSLVLLALAGVAAYFVTKGA